MLPSLLVFHPPVIFEPVERIRYEGLADGGQLNVISLPPCRQ
jgi:hypothetical protein